MSKQTAPVETVTLSFQVSRAAETRAVSDIKTIKVTVSGPQLDPQTTSFPFDPQHPEKPYSLQVTVGPGRQFQLEALNASQQAIYVGQATQNIVVGANSVSVDLFVNPKVVQSVQLTGTINDGPPAIEFTYVPAYGSFDNLKGRVKNVLPSSAKVVVFIYVNSSWWPKPYYNSPFTPVKADGTFEVDITTGGVDERATEIRGYLVGESYDNKLQLPPDPVTTDVWAMAKAIRQPK